MFIELRPESPIPLYLQIVQHLKALIEGGMLPDEEGMRIEALESLVGRHRPKLLFIIPAFQAPTGITMSRERRENLLAFATEHQIPIVEDEYLHELRYDGSPLPPLKALDRQGTVVYIGTFSKVLAPVYA